MSLRNHSLKDGAKHMAGFFEHAVKDGTEFVKVATTRRASQDGGPKRELRRVSSLLVSNSSDVKRKVLEEIKREYCKAQDDEPQKQVYDHWFLEHKYFQAFAYTLIVLNTIFLAVIIEKSPLNSDEMVIERTGDMIFTAFFAIEIVIKLKFMGRHFFRFTLNWIDVVLVMMSSLQAAIGLAADMWNSDGVEHNLRQYTVIRVLRLVRLLRILRLAKAKREIIMLIEGVGASLRPMFWIGVLFIAAVLICAIPCKDLIGEADSTYQDEAKFDNRVLFGSIGRSAVTLINIALVAEWDFISRSIYTRQPALLPFFLAFIACTSLGVMNVIVGVIVERTNAASMKMKAQDSARQRAHDLETIVQLTDMMFRDAEHLSGEELIDLLEAPSNADLRDKCVEAISVVEFPFDFGVIDLHTMLDQDGDGELNRGEVLKGLTRLIESSPFQHECMAQKSRCQIKRHVHLLGQEIKQQFDWVREEIQRLREELVLPTMSESQQASNGEAGDVGGKSDYGSETQDSRLPCERSQLTPTLDLDLKIISPWEQLETSTFVVAGGSKLYSRQRPGSSTLDKTQDRIVLPEDRKESREDQTNARTPARCFPDVAANRNDNTATVGYLMPQKHSGDMPPGATTISREASQSCSPRDLSEIAVEITERSL